MEPPSEELNRVLKGLSVYSPFLAIAAWSGGQPPPSPYSAQPEKQDQNNAKLMLYQHFSDLGAQTLPAHMQCQLSGLSLAAKHVVDMHVCPRSQWMVRAPSTLDITKYKSAGAHHDDRACWRAFIPGMSGGSTSFCPSPPLPAPLPSTVNSTSTPSNASTTCTHKSGPSARSLKVASC